MEGTEELKGEGIYTDDKEARARMPELPMFDDDDVEKVPIYLDDSCLGNQTWVEGPFTTMEEAKQSWQKLCLQAHRCHYDSAHSDGRAQAACNLKERAYTAKHGMAFIASKQGSQSTLRPLVESLDFTLWVVTFENALAFESLYVVSQFDFDKFVDEFDRCLAHLHAADISKRKRLFVVMLSQSEAAAKDVFTELIGRIRDQVNNVELARELAQKL
ncbi:hypothetical protein V5O48_017879 [Marasmius crinis-equi]|uniref:Uncharacterized protein n=1 Tax=Marasmius crinis-equi TaxID=585013 RepID=A0ABR3EMR9_9AGAR